MNGTFESGDEPDNMGSESIGSYGYTVGISFGVFLAILFLTYSAYMCKLMRSRNNLASSHSASVETSTDDNSASTVRGLDEATLLACPKFLYSEIDQLLDGGATVSGCSICLANYRAADVIRLLPDCGHLFHLKCVDTWLRVHPTCPICRTSPVATPLATPMAESVPLATV